MTCGRPGHGRPKCSYGGRASRARRPTCTPKKRASNYTQILGPLNHSKTDATACSKHKTGAALGRQPLPQAGSPRPGRHPGPSTHAPGDAAPPHGNARVGGRANGLPFCPRAHVRGGDCLCTTGAARVSGRRSATGSACGAARRGLGTAQRCCVDNLFEPPQQALPARRSCVA